MNKKSPKSFSDIVALVIKVLLYLFIVVYLLLGLFSEQIFGPDNIFTQNIGSVLNIKNSMEDRLPSLLKSTTYIILIVVANKIISFLLKKWLSKMKTGKTIVNLTHSFIKYFSGIAIVFLVLNAFGVNTTTLLASAGILGLAVGLGAQSLIEDIIAGLFIVFEKTFVVGDVVIISGYRGTIKEVGIRTTKIVDIGGDTKIINNSRVGDVINMTNNLSLAICDVEIEYGESLERVETILSENLALMGSRIEGIVEGPFYKGVGSLNPNGVSLKIIANCDERVKFQVMRELNREIKLLFDDHQISIPFQHLVINDSTSFSKPSEAEKIKARAYMLEQKKLSKHIESDQQ